MERIYTPEVAHHVGERVRVAGSLHTLRRLGGINFLVLRDARGTVQVVVDTAESAGITFPNFIELVESVGGDAAAR